MMSCLKKDGNGLLSHHINYATEQLNIRYNNLFSYKCNQRMDRVTSTGEFEKNLRGKTEGN